MFAGGRKPIGSKEEQVSRFGESQAGKGQIVVLVVIAVVLAVAYFALDRYNAGQKEMLTVETRGLQMISALTKYKQETGAYPDTLEKLVPKHVAAVSKCPDGQAIGYSLAGGEYTLSCRSHTYDSRSRSWTG